MGVSTERTVFLKKRAEQYEDYYHLLNHWLEAKNYGASARDYFLANGWKNIAIYGMGDLANRLMEDLGNSDIGVKYGIDRDAAGTVARISDIYSPNDKLPEVDVVVITPFYAYKPIQEMLKKKLDCPVISLENVIWSI